MLLVNSYLHLIILYNVQYTCTRYNVPKENMARSGKTRKT